MIPCTHSDPQGLRGIGPRAWGPHPPSPAPMPPHTPSAARAVPLGTGVMPGEVPEAWKS